ncbi:MAG: molybdopterin synthase sulfur carrier subunit [Hyphomicrobiales bacterium]|nr:molybdopterin synthase sulfur carrier subunit [Hyphomicrobiales bacterium]
MTSGPSTIDVRLPPLLLHMFPTAPSRLSLEASDVASMIDALDQRWPGMADCIRDSRPAIRRHINVFVDGQRAKLETPLRSGTDVFILTAISGG